MINLRTYPLILAVTVPTIVYFVAIILSAIWPDICWLPRVGGSLVGISLVIQGVVDINEVSFSSEWRWGLTRKQIYLHIAITSAILGTLIWTFGDLSPTLLWVDNTACIKRL